MLPQSYLADRGVLTRLLLATDARKGKQELEAALTDTSDSSWPEAHYLAPLHPVLDWAADRALASLARNQVFVVRGSVECPTLLVVGTLTNRRGQTVSASWVRVEFPDPNTPSFALAEVAGTPRELFASVGFDQPLDNPGPAADLPTLTPLVAAGVDAATSQLDLVMSAAQESARNRIRAWSERTSQWQAEAAHLAQRLDLRRRRLSVAEEERLIAAMAPTQPLVRPLLLVVPADHRADFGATAGGPNHAAE